MYRELVRWIVMFGIRSAMRLVNATQKHAARNYLDSSVNAAGLNSPPDENILSMRERADMG